MNAAFYARNARDFDRTRHAAGWPGWRRVVRLAAAADEGDDGARGGPSRRAAALRVLDLGCGNGRFALFLERNSELRSRRPFHYRGIDLSPNLVGRARRASAAHLNIRFDIADLESCPLDLGAFDLVVLFGVLHHLPGLALRRQAIERAAAALAPGGLLAITCWQFTDAPDFARRRLDWDVETDVDPARLENGDHLLRWGGADSTARRYCHETTEDELALLIQDLALNEVDRYRADGADGRRNLYWLGRASNRQAGGTLRKTRPRTTANPDPRSSWEETPR